MCVHHYAIWRTLAVAELFVCKSIDDTSILHNKRINRCSLLIECVAVYTVFCGQLAQVTDIFHVFDRDYDSIAGIWNATNPHRFLSGAQEEIGVLRQPRNIDRISFGIAQNKTKVLQDMSELMICDLAFAFLN